MTERTFVSSRGNLIEIMIDSEIGPPSEYRNEFIALSDASENDEVIININTPGGDLSTAVNFFNVMRQCRAPITTVAVGDVCSAGSMIFLAGDEMVVHPHISFLAHNAMTGGYPGKDADVLAFSQHSSSMLRDFMTDVYQHFLNDQELELMIEGKEYWMKSDEVVQRLQTRAEALEAQNGASPEEAENAVDPSSMSAKELKSLAYDVTGKTAGNRKEAERLLGL